MAAGSIVIDLLMKTGSFESSSNNARRSLNKFQKDAIELGKTVAKVGAATVAVGAGVAVAWTKSVAESGKEIDRLATLSNTSAEEFQKLAYASETVGIEQEKLSDIFKDVQDRIGDFMATGGGPMADFFENIAPLVGVTADEFARLSGPEALQLYHDSLQKAGASQSEMIFYMEAMASDSALLSPLLADNGRKMTELGDQASRLGGIMSNETVRAAKELDNNLKSLRTMFSGVSTMVANEVLPIVNEFIVDMFESATKTDGLYSSVKDLSSDTTLKSWIEGIARTLAILAEMAIKAAQAIRAVAMSAMAVGADIGYVIGAVKLTKDSIFNPSKADEIAAAWTRMSEARRDVIDDAGQSWSNLFSDEFSIYNSMERAIAEASNKSNNPVLSTLKNFSVLKPPKVDTEYKPTGGGRGKGGGGAKSDAGADYIRSLNERIALLGKETEHEQLLAKISVGSMQFRTEAQKQLALEAAKQYDQTKQQIELEETLRDLREQQTITQMQFMRELEAYGQGNNMRELIGDLARVEDRYRSIIDARRNSPLGLSDEELELIRESLNTELEMVRQHHEAKRELEANWQLGALEGLRNYADEAANVYQQTADLISGAFSKLEDELVSFVTTGEMDLVGMLRSVGSEVVRMLIRTGLQMAANAILGQTTAAASAAMATATGSAMAAAYAPAAAMASLASFGANSAPAMAGIASTVGMAQGLSLVGMAHDGIDSVPKTGTWLLEKGERVTTAETSARLDSVLDRIDKRSAGGITVNLIENPERAGQVVERTNESGEREADIFVADIMGDGKRARALERAYGLQRVGA